MDKLEYEKKIAKRKDFQKDCWKLSIAITVFLIIACIFIFMPTEKMEIEKMGPFVALFVFSFLIAGLCIHFISGKHKMLKKAEEILAENKEFILRALTTPKSDITFHTVGCLIEKMIVLAGENDEYDFILAIKELYIGKNDLAEEDVDYMIETSGVYLDIKDSIANPRKEAPSILDEGKANGQFYKFVKVALKSDKKAVGQIIH